jgi:hypothetical protein
MENIAQNSPRFKSLNATAQDNTPQDDTSPKTNTTELTVHGEGKGGPLAWIWAQAFCTVSGVIVLALAALILVLFQIVAQLCMSGALLQVAAQPYHREMEPLGVLTFIFSVVGPPIGVFGSIIWVVSASRRNCLAAYRAQMTALRQGSCFAEYTNRQHMLRCKLGFSRAAEFLAVVALLTYIAIMAVITVCALLPPWVNPGFS